MPRRSSTRAAPSVPALSPDPAFSSAPALPSSLSQNPNLTHLRSLWKWASFSQFFFTFSALFAMHDVSLNDIEEDLINSTNIFLPRIMQRMLYTLTQDRKISIENWQHALRKQYYKRDPLANPIGPQPTAAFPEPTGVRASRTTSVAASVEPQVSIEKSVEPLLHDTSGDSSALHPSVNAPALDVNTPAPDTVPNTPAPDTSANTPAAMCEDHDGGIAESKDWLNLPMSTKLDSMCHLMEWQFQNPTRLRGIMKDDDENASWRIEPIGYDAKKNAYWLIGADRLWIQRALPRLPKPTKNLKRKRPATEKRTLDRSMPKQTPAAATKRPRLDAMASLASKGGRVAKAQANMKLDAQAKELAAFQREAASGKRDAIATPLPGRPMGTRVSRRLRGNVEDEWQPVPEEWLAGTDGEQGGRQGKSSGQGKLKTGLESGEGSISDLTELSSEREEETLTPKKTNVESDGETLEVPDVPEGFIEWETICVTLFEWDHVAEQFEKATHYAEKALYKVLVHSIVPAVTEDLREIERKRKLEDAVVHRKRSSRIAIKESEKEEARAVARKKAEEDAHMSRARRLQARQEKEEADRLRRESAREQRRKEREEKEKQENEKSDMTIEAMGYGKMENSHVNGIRSVRPIGVNGSGTTSGSRTPAGDDWELDCEICHRRGINQDDGSPMMCCGMCSKWQHIACHDNADYEAGRPKRNWVAEDFICRQCRQRAEQDGYSQQHLSQRYQDPKQFSLTTRQHKDAHALSSYVQSGVSTPAYLNSQPHSPTANDTMHGQNESTHVRGSPVQQSRAYQAHSAITFTHYQPQQHGFSTHGHQQPNPFPQSQPYVRQRSSYGQPASDVSRPNSSLSYSHQPSIRPAQSHMQPHSQEHQVGWNAVTPESQHSPYGMTTSHSSSTSPFRPEPNYPHYSRPSTASQWQPPENEPGQPLNQYSQFRYHQAMGSTSYHSSSS